MEKTRDYSLAELTSGQVAPDRETIDFKNASQEDILDYLDWRIINSPSFQLFPRFKAKPKAAWRV